MGQHMGLTLESSVFFNDRAQQNSLSPHGCYSSLAIAPFKLFTRSRTIELSNIVVGDLPIDRPGNLALQFVSTKVDGSDDENEFTVEISTLNIFVQDGSELANSVLFASFA